MYGISPDRANTSLRTSSTPACSLYVLVDDTRTLHENEAYRSFYNYWLQTASFFGGDSPLLILHNQKADRARTGFNLGSFQAIFPFVKELFCINLGDSQHGGHPLFETTNRTLGTKTATYRRCGTQNMGKGT